MVFGRAVGAHCASQPSGGGIYSLVYVRVYYIHISLSSEPLLNERNCMNTPSCSIVRVPASSRFTGSKFYLQVHILIMFPVIDVAFCVSYPWLGRWPLSSVRTVKCLRRTDPARAGWLGVETLSNESMGGTSRVVWKGCGFRSWPEGEIPFHSTRPTEQ